MTKDPDFGHFARREEGFDELDARAQKACVGHAPLGDGLGAMLSLKPRTEATGENNKKFQVDERITTLSYEAHVKYTHKDWFVGAKSVLGSNLTQASGLGGFGVKSVNERTGEQKLSLIHI